MANRFKILSAQTAKVTAPYSSIPAIQNGYNPVQITTSSGETYMRVPEQPLLFDRKDPDAPTLITDQIPGREVMALIEALAGDIVVLESRTVNLDARITALGG